LNEFDPFDPIKPISDWIELDWIGLMNPTDWIDWIGLMDYTDWIG
jgi:hypothetical protein